VKQQYCRATSAFLALWLRLKKSHEINLACQEASSLLLLRLSLSPFHLLLLSLVLRRLGGNGRRPGRPLVARDLQRPKTVFYTNPAQPRRVKKDKY